MGKTEFADLEQELGRRHVPTSINLDQRLRREGLWKPRSFLYYDYMHVYFASGGVMQLILNSTAVKLVTKTRFTLQDLDDFTQSQFRGVRHPRWRRLPSDFWQKRVQREQPSVPKPLKCFAWECSVALSIMCLLGRSVMEPEQVLVPHFQLLALAHRISQALQDSDRHGTRCDEQALADNIAELHRKCISVHGVAICKMKAHLQHHIPRCIKDHGNVVLSCFSCEARVRFVKQAAYNSSRLPPATKCSLPLQRLCIQLEMDLSSFEIGVSITGKTRKDCFLHLLPVEPRPSGAFYGKEVRGPNGRLKALQFAFVEIQPGRRALCQALGFVQPHFDFDSNRNLVFAVMHVFQQTGSRWNVDAGNLVTVPISAVGVCVPVAAHGDDSVSILTLQ